MANAIEYVTPDILRTELEAQDKRFDAKLDASGTELRGEMATLRTELRGEMATLRTELRGEMATLRTELRGEMAELRTDMQLLRTEMLEAFTAAVRGFEESTRAHIAALDDKYRDVPSRLGAVETRTEDLVPRVEHVERTLFAPEPPRRRRRAQRR